MFFIWLITLLVCFLDFYLLQKVKIKIGSYQRKRNTVDMSWHLIFDIVILLIVLLLITSNRTGVDIVNYNNWYIREQPTTREPLYTFLRIYSHRKGITFFGFRTLLTFISGVFFYQVCRKNSVPISFVMCCYLPSMFFIDSMQFRNAVALCIMLFATDYLIKDMKCKMNRIVYLISVIIAAQIHTSFYAFLIFLPMCSKRKKVYAKIIFICGILLLGVSVLNNRSVPFVDLVYNVILSSGDNRSYEYAGGHNIFLYPMFVHLLSTGLLLYYARFWKSKKNNDYEKNYIDFINVINLIFFLFVTLTMMSTTFYRFLRNMYMFDIFSAYYLIRNSHNNKRKLAIFIGMILISLLWLYFMVGIYSSSKVLIYPIFKYGIWFWKD